MDFTYNADKIRKLSSELQIALEKLQGLSELSKQEFLADFHKIASAKYLLIVSIEAAIDLCNHIISANRYRTPDDYADTFKVMEENKFFAKKFTEQLMQMARFRNRLVHIYWDVNDELVYTFLQEDIHDLELFLERFIKSLNEKKDKQ